MIPAAMSAVIKHILMNSITSAFYVPRKFVYYVPRQLTALNAAPVLFLFKEYVLDALTKF